MGRYGVIILFGFVFLLFLFFCYCLFVTLVHTSEIFNRSLASESIVNIFVKGGGGDRTVGGVKFFW